jgi:SAM-dependent methyltransferase
MATQDILAPPSESADSCLESLRRRELESLRPWFAPGTSVLELGGRSGFHAAILRSWGCSVTSVDVVPPDQSPQYHPVFLYDGRHLPFADGSFDVVFSSHMLYHVFDEPELFQEMRRVLVPGGRSIHLMPSVTWRVAAALAHYANLARKVPSVLSRRRRGSPLGTAAPVPKPDTSTGGSSATASRPRGLAALARLALVPPPLGSADDVVTEARQFRRSSMIALLRANGFDTVAIVPSHVFYTPYELLGRRLPVAARAAMSSLLGSSSVSFVGQPRRAAEKGAATAVDASIER